MRRLFCLIYLSLLGLEVPVCYGLRGFTRSRTGTGRFQQKIRKQNQEKGNVVSKFIEQLTTGSVKSGPRLVHFALYWITAFDALQCVLVNDYASIIQISTSTKPSSVYSKLFFFARMRPRLLFSIGALLRALQLCTPFQKVIDPSIGVGAGINLCCSFAGSRWPQQLTLGWALTKSFWKWLGARQLDRAFVPITLSINKKTRKDVSSK